MKYTGNLKLKKPELEDYVDVDDLNENMDILDEKVNGNSDTLNDLTKNLGDKSTLNTVDKSSIVKAINEVNFDFNEYPSDYDDNDIARTVDWKRIDGKLYRRSILSNPDANGNYLNQAITYYAADGITIDSTELWQYTFDAKGRKTSEVRL